jgi:hypothetical protein
VPPRRSIAGSAFLLLAGADGRVVLGAVDLSNTVGDGDDQSGVRGVAALAAWGLPKARGTVAEQAGACGQRVAA